MNNIKFYNCKAVSTDMYMTIKARDNQLNDILNHQLSNHKWTTNDNRNVYVKANKAYQLYIFDDAVTNAFTLTSDGVDDIYCRISLSGKKQRKGCLEIPYFL